MAQALAPLLRRTIGKDSAERPVADATAEFCCRAVAGLAAGSAAARAQLTAAGIPSALEALIGSGVAQAASAALTSITCPGALAALFSWLPTSCVFVALQE